MLVRQHGVWASTPTGQTKSGFKFQARCELCSRLAKTGAAPASGAWL